MSKIKTISIRGAREHNLKNINLDLPRNKLIVITGLSGSGKSSLAFDTIYAEGQRRYVESLSTYARQFLEIVKKPDVDRIDGLSPAISIDQKNTSHNPRSTVGTTTEIYDYMRLLFARIGIAYSPATGLPIKSQTVSQMTDRILLLDHGTRIYILAPIIRNRKGEYKKELSELSKKGFQRVKIDGQFYQIDNVPSLDKRYKHDIDIVIDRIVIHENIKVRLADSLETCLRLSNGLVVVEFIDNKSSYDQINNQKNQSILFSERFSCPLSGFNIPEIEPRLFSFNNPAGACNDCYGLGKHQKIEETLVIPNPELPLNKGAIAAWPQSSLYYKQTLDSLGKALNFKIESKWSDIPEKIQKNLLYGTSEKIPFHYIDEEGSYTTRKKFEGIIPLLERRKKETDSQSIREEIERYTSSSPCSSCNGYRLKPEALAIKIDQKHIGEIANMSIKEAVSWFDTLTEKLTKKQCDIADSIIKEIKDRLNLLDKIGLNYLTLSRSSSMLSGGESQRIRLASQIGAGLTGVLYVLDEPSIGLHQRDNARLIKILKHLRDIGNTVIVVEHDEDTILAADYIVDIGPAAGINGGQVVAAGSPSTIIEEVSSITGQYLSRKITTEVPKDRRKPDPGHTIKIVGARSNNLKNVTASIPLGLFTAITGVSGSGKSTFLISTLYKIASRHVMGSRDIPGIYDQITGLEKIDKVIEINQSPIGRTPRSNPATYIGAFTNIREWFSNLPEAKARGYQAGRFSFNIKGGRCEICKGDGVTKIEMHFLPDIYITCDACGGQRYNRETLEITFKGKTISEVLCMSVEESLDFFSSVPAIRNKLQTLKDVGLGYIKIGQQATRLSGGEAQRVKLSKELSRSATGSTLYILDEPTTGLHFHDVAKLLEILHSLTSQGNSVVVIEHNLDVIKTADWIIDFGPEGGNDGGEVIAYGSPEDIIKEPLSHTGFFLKTLLKKNE